MGALSCFAWVAFVDVAIVAHVSCFVLLVMVIARDHQLHHRFYVTHALDSHFMIVNLEVSLTIEVSDQSPQLLSSHCVDTYEFTLGYCVESVDIFSWQGCHYIIK